MTAPAISIGPEEPHFARHFRGKRITLMGLGLLGRGVGDAAYLASCGADVIVTDTKPASQLQSSLARLKHFRNITYRLSGHVHEDFSSRDLIIKAAGVQDDSPYLKTARGQGIPVRMSTDLFAELSPLPVIGVTGTRGKSTVAHMIYSIFKAAGVPALLGGNIQGVSTLAMLASTKDESAAILELDSWQLQGFGASKRSPHIAVFTTFYQDHLSYYQNDMERYLADKAHIFLHQGRGDTFIVGDQAAAQLALPYRDALARSIVVSEEDAKDLRLRVPGLHNRYNAACARAAARAFGIDEEAIRSGLETFSGVPGRLELVREDGGVRIYNDTTAVTPDATCAGIETLKGNPITLIAGGKDKKCDLGVLVELIHSHVAHVILLPGSGSDIMARYIPDAVRSRSLREAVFRARELTPAGGSILFSPVFSSIGMFENVYDRGEQFIEALDAVWIS